MRKLSELPMGTMICITDQYYDMLVISKEDILQDDTINIKEKSVSVAKKEVMKFNLWDILEQIGEEAYEDWAEDVYNEIKDDPRTVSFMQMIKEVFKKTPTYYEGEAVEIDMELEGEKKA